jgi:hypothetical protein
MLFERGIPLPGCSKVKTAVTVPCQLLSVFIFLKYEDFGDGLDIFILQIIA